MKPLRDTHPYTPGELLSGSRITEAFYRDNIPFVRLQGLPEAVCVYGDKPRPSGKCPCGRDFDRPVTPGGISKVCQLCDIFPLNFLTETPDEAIIKYIFLTANDSKFSEAHRLGQICESLSRYVSDNKKRLAPGGRL